MSLQVTCVKPPWRSLPSLAEPLSSPCPDVVQQNEDMLAAWTFTNDYLSCLRGELSPGVRNRTTRQIAPFVILGLRYIVMRSQSALATTTSETRRSWFLAGKEAVDRFRRWTEQAGQRLHRNDVDNNHTVLDLIRTHRLRNPEEMWWLDIVCAWGEERIKDLETRSEQYLQCHTTARPPDDSEASRWTELAEVYTLILQYRTHGPPGTKSLLEQHNIDRRAKVVEGQCMRLKLKVPFPAVQDEDGDDVSRVADNDQPKKKRKLRNKRVR